MSASSAADDSSTFIKLCSRFFLLKPSEKLRNSFHFKFDLVVSKIYKVQCGSICKIFRRCVSVLHFIVVDMDLFYDLSYVGLTNVVAFVNILVQTQRRFFDDRFQISIWVLPLLLKHIHTILKSFNFT